MRIMHLVNTANTVGNGITNVAIDLVVAQAEAGHDVVLGSLRGDLWRLTAVAGARHSVLDFTARGAGLLRTGLRLRHAIRDFRPDVVHCHTIVPTVLARLAAAGTGALVVATIHNEYQRGVELMRFAHHLFGVSDAVTEAMRAKGARHDRVSTVVNGPVGSKRMPAEFAAVDLGDRAVVFCGGLTHRKGIDLLLAAFGRVAAEVPDARLVLVGSTDWEEVPALVGLTGAAARIERVGFQADPRPWIAASRVFVLPSRHDPMPLVIPEAMAQGVPVIGADVDGIPEALDHGAAGKLVPQGDAEALADAMVTLLTDDEEAARYGEAGRRRSEYYTVERLASDTEAEYCRLIDRRRIR